MRDICPRCHSTVRIVAPTDSTTIGETDHVKMLSEELYRVRTTQQAAAHALDTLRQHYGLDLIDMEHPMETVKRIMEARNE